MWFKYAAYNANGDMTAGALEADSENAAEALLWKSDLTIISLNKKRTAPSLSFPG